MLANSPSQLERDPDNPCPGGPLLSMARRLPPRPGAGAAQQRLAADEALASLGTSQLKPGTLAGRENELCTTCAGWRNSTSERASHLASAAKSLVLRDRMSVRRRGDGRAPCFGRNIGVDCRVAVYSLRSGASRVRSVAVRRTRDRGPLARACFDGRFVARAGSYICGRHARRWPCRRRTPRRLQGPSDS